MQDVLTAGVRLSQDKGVWWLSQAGDRVAFYDGIAIRDGKLPAPAERNARELARIKKQTDAINKFVRPLLDLSKPLPQPNGGDCWLCMVGHSDCLRSHLKENYLHGTLIANALRHAGLTDIGVALWLCEGTPSASSRRLIAGRVRRYLKAKMGLVAR
jgi:hypothetical protein